MRVFALVAAAVLFAAAVPGQELLWERQGVANQSAVGNLSSGYSMPIVIGDLNGDGYDDLLQSATSFKPAQSGIYHWAELWLLSGKDGKTLRILRAPSVFWQFETVTQTGDMNADGIPDYATMRRDIRNPCCRPTVVEVRSGKDDRLLWKVEGPADKGFASSMLGNLDLDGDKKPDLVLTETRGGTDYHPGAVYAYSNQGKLLWKIVGTNQLEIGSHHSTNTLARMGDIDRDGADDFVVGGVDLVARRGAAILISGRTGKVILKGLSPLQNEIIGDSVAGCGDLDLDGVVDFAASSRGFGSIGIVVGFSGKTGKVLFTWKNSMPPNRPKGGFAGPLRSRGLDFDRDGIPDVVVGGGGDRPLLASVVVVSGRNGALIHRVLSVQLSSYWFDVLPPQPGSPFPLFVACEPGVGSYASKWWNIPLYLGSVRVYRSSPASVQVFGSACRGTLTTIPRIGIRDLANNGLRLHLSGAAPGSPALLLLGLSRKNWGTIPLPLALGPFGFRGCKLYTSVDLPIVLSTGNIGLSAGYAYFDFPFRLSKKGLLSMHAQWLSLGTGKLAPGGLSDAILWRSK